MPPLRFIYAVLLQKKGAYSQFPAFFLDPPYSNPQHQQTRSSTAPLVCAFGAHSQDTSTALPRALFCHKTDIMGGAATKPEWKLRAKPTHPYPSASCNAMYLVRVTGMRNGTECTSVCLRSLSETTPGMSLDRREKKREKTEEPECQL